MGCMGKHEDEVGAIGVKREKARSMRICLESGEPHDKAKDKELEMRCT